MDVKRGEDRSAERAEEARARRARAARKARGLLADAAPGRVLSEELIAERREEARRESAGVPARTA